MSVSFSINKAYLVRHTCIPRDWRGLYLGRSGIVLKLHLRCLSLVRSFFSAYVFRVGIGWMNCCISILTSGGKHTLIPGRHYSLKWRENAVRTFWWWFLKLVQVDDLGPPLLFGGIPLPTNWIRAPRGETALFKKGIGLMYSFVQCPSCVLNMPYLHCIT